MAFYAVLAARGFIPAEWLDGFGRFDSPLGHHPDRNLVPGVEIASGSLGHGLPIALGVALALDARADRRAPGLRADRRRGAGRGQQPRSHRPGRADAREAADRGGRRQRIRRAWLAVRRARLVWRDRTALRARGLGDGHRRRPRSPGPGRSPRRSGDGPALGSSLLAPSRRRLDDGHNARPLHRRREPNCSTRTRASCCCSRTSEPIGSRHPVLRNDIPGGCATSASGSNS